VDPRHVLSISSESAPDVVDRIVAAAEAGHLRYSLTTG
jgi:hypothetical protein